MVTTNRPLSLSDIFAKLVVEVSNMPERQVRPLYESAVVNRRRGSDPNLEPDAFDPDQEYAIVWVSQIFTTNVNGTGGLETLSEVEWELRLYTRRETETTQQEREAQQIAQRLYGRWYQHPNLPLSLIHISEPTRLRRSRMPSSA